MMKDCNNMSRADFLNYAAQFGKEAAVGCCYFAVLMDLMRIMMSIKI